MSCTADAEPDRRKPDDPIFAEFPTKSGKPWALLRSKADGLAKAYPGVDVAAEALRMTAWLEANPGRRKTARGMPRFVRAWIERAHERGSVSPPNGAQAAQIARVLD